MKLKPLSVLATLLAAAAIVAVGIAPYGQDSRAQDSSEMGRTLEAAPPEGAGAPGDEALPGQVTIDVTAPERALYRMAVPNLLGDDSLGPQGADVLRNDFRLVSLFEVLDARSFLADLTAEGLGLTPGAWASVGAQGVIKGQITRNGSNLRVEMRFYELARGGAATVSRTYNGAPGELRNFMHDFANLVLEQLTGRRGAFGSRIAFARRVREGRKDVYVASFDGHSVSRVSTGNGVAMLPNFGPGGIWYSLLTDTGMFITRTNANERPIIDAPESMNMGISICGDRAYFTSTRDGNAEIYSSALDGTDARRLTDHPGIDVSPACGGPGGQIAFVSNRHGSPQIFAMGPTGGAPRRLTFRGSYNQTPSWCPIGEEKLLAFTGRAAGLDVFTVQIDTQQYTRLTQGQGVNKDPAFSPDCRMVAFYSTRGGIYVSSPEGLNHQLVVPGVAETLRWR